MNVIVPFVGSREHLNYRKLRSNLLLKLQFSYFIFAASFGDVFSSVSKNVIGIIMTYICARE